VIDRKISIGGGKILYRNFIFYFYKKNQCMSDKNLN